MKAGILATILELKEKGRDSWMQSPFPPLCSCHEQTASCILQARWWPSLLLTAKAVQAYYAYHCEIQLCKTKQTNMHAQRTFIASAATVHHICAPVHMLRLPQQATSPVPASNMTSHLRACTHGATICTNSTQYSHKAATYSNYTAAFPLPCYKGSPFSSFK